MRLVTLWVSEGAWKKSLKLGQQRTIIFTITHWWDSGRHRTYSFDYTLPVCVVVTWRRIIRISGVFLREPVLIKFSMFSPSTDPPLLPPADFSFLFFFLHSSTRYFCSNSAAMWGEEERSSSAAVWMLGNFVVAALLSLSLSFNISFSPLTPSLPPVLHLLRLLSPPMGRGPGDGRMSLKKTHPS